MAETESLAITPSGNERWHSRAYIPRHRHARAYAAVVLEGSYEESGSRGRFRVRPGDVVLHEFVQDRPDLVGLNRGYDGRT
jgi:hypothetical protein